jgi:N-acyl-D-amino-acid deacylase
MRATALILSILLLASCAPDYDVIIRGGTVYDGSGGDPISADIGISADTIAAIGDLNGATAAREIDASAQAVSPGFINMLSWANESLIEDGLSQSDIRQGVTLEVFGEGTSPGPINEAMRAETIEQMADIRYEIPWTTLGEYLEFLEEKGVATNVASFIGATTLRIHEVGYENRPATAEELDRMRALVRQGMAEGAMGIGSSLIYAPAFYAPTEELVEISKVAAEYGGMYIYHIRNESNQLVEAIEELIRIARAAEIPAEIYHLKAGGQVNWSKMDVVLNMVEVARASGLQITADMYTYPAGATGLDAAMPPDIQEGGLDAWVERLKDPNIRRATEIAMRTPTDDYENLYIAAGSADNVLLVAFKEDSLRHLTGKTLAEVAELYGTSPEVTAMDLVIKDHTRVGTVYFLMSEENIRKQIAKPWVSFGSDGESLAAEGVFLNNNPHPRAYGNVARLLGRYVRDEGVISLQEAVRRLSGLPAENLKLRKRGTLTVGNFADVVVFDPATIADHATFAEPHQYSTGVDFVFVNGQIVLSDGEPTGITSGRVVRGPGWTGWEGPESQ